MSLTVILVRVRPFTIREAAQLYGRHFDTANLVANGIIDKKTMTERSFSATALWPLRLRQSYTNAVSET